MGFLILILFLSIVISISLGSASIPPFEVIKIILAKINDEGAKLFSYFTHRFHVTVKLAH